MARKRFALALASLAFSSVVVAEEAGGMPEAPPAPVEPPAPAPAPVAVPAPPPPAPAKCPPPPERDFAESLELNYFFHHFPRVRPSMESPVIFEGQIAPHFFPWNSQDEVEVKEHDARRPTTWLGRAYEVIGLQRLFGTRALLRPGLAGALWVDTFSVTPMIRLRMVDDASAPVRPPSFMPRFDYQLFAYWKPDRWDGRAAPWLNLLELRVTPFGHHSNGQQYCLFDRQVLDEEGACPPIDVASPPLKALNRWSGSFSTNYWGAGARFTHLWLDRDETEAHRLGLGVFYEENPIDFIFGGITRETAALYGRRRLEVQLQAALRAFGFFRAELAYLWTSETPEPIPDWRARAELSYRGKKTGGAGLFVRYVAGQDYMNALFAGPAIHLLEIGVVWDKYPDPKYAFVLPEER